MKVSEARLFVKQFVMLEAIMIQPKLDVNFELCWQAGFFRSPLGYQLDPISGSRCERCENEALCTWLLGW
jgi:hypothetical protein